MSTAPSVVDQLLDPGSFTSWDTEVDLTGFDADYRAALARAARRSGADEAVLTGRGEVGGRPVALVVGEFGFLAGSIGREAARRITAAVRRAGAEGLPLVASTASGGTRMQEGTPAFVRMIEISRAVVAHRAAGLPYLVHLRHPTTGGVLASWGSLGHLTLAEPGALVGFLGPKVYEGLHGEPFPAGVQVAEHLAERGVLDGVVATADLRGAVDAALAVLVDPPSTRALPLPEGPGEPPADPWQAVLATRDPGRCGISDLLRHGATSTTRLRGTGEGEADDAVVVALARLDGQPCVVVGHDRTAPAPLGPAGLRAARRGIRLAAELRLPLVTVVDTSGAELSAAAEERAMAGEIARCVAELAALDVPSVGVLLGQGCGGGALALLATDEVLATARSWLSPLPPEGASVIVHGDTAHAPSVARAQRVGAHSLVATGLVQQVVPEPAGQDVADLARSVAAALAARLEARRG